MLKARLLLRLKELVWTLVFIALPDDEFFFCLWSLRHAVQLPHRAGAATWERGCGRTTRGGRHDSHFWGLDALVLEEGGAVVCVLLAVARLTDTLGEDDVVAG